MARQTLFTNEDLMRKVQQARQAGVSEDIIARKVNESLATRKSKKPGFVKSVVQEGFVKPVENFARFTGEAAAQAGRAVANPAMLKSALGQELTREEQKKLAGMQESFFVDPEDIATRKDIVKTGAKRTAGAASLVVPAGTGGSLARGVALGATSGALRSFSEPDATFSDIATGATIGGVTGGAIIGSGRLLHRLSPRVSAALNAGRGKTQDASTSLRGSVAQPKVPASPFSIEEEVAIVRTLDRLGVKGSAQAQRQQIPSAMRRLTDDIQSILGKSKKTKTIDEIVSSLDDGLNNSLNYVPDDTLHQKARERLVNGLIRKAKNGKLSAKQVFEYKQFLGDKLGRAFDKLDKGQPLTPQEDIAMTLWQTTDDIMTAMEKGVKDLTKTQSYLFAASPGLKKASDQTLRLPILGTRFSARPAQALTSATAGGLSRASNVGTGQAARLGREALAGINTPIGREAGAMLGRNAILGQTLTDEEQLPQELQSLQILGGTPTSQISPSQAQFPQAQAASGQRQIDPQTGLPMLTARDVALARIQLSDGAADKIEALFEAQQGSGSNVDLSAAQKKKLGSLSTAEGIVDTVEASFNELNTSDIAPFARVGGFRRSIGGSVGTNVNAATYKSTRDGAASLLLKALGEAGTLSDADIQRATNLLPNLGDSPQEAEVKISRLKNIIEQSRQGVFEAAAL